MPTKVTQLRIFISSPGDVPEERQIAFEVIERLAYNPIMRGRVSFEVVAWDKTDNSTPMLATKTPQQAINEGLPMPCDCDIVVVILWSRMGTPLPHPDYQKADGSPYWSGTEWEYWNGVEGARENNYPEVVIYRRTEDPVLTLADPNLMQKHEQWQRVQQFFEQFYDPHTGAILGGFNSYANPADFEHELENHLLQLVTRLLERPQRPTHSQITPTLNIWRDSPFPGLRAFGPEDAPIFFGRSREIDELLKRLAMQKFVAVVGASGSGKSSLVAAGLLPRLQANAIATETINSQEWVIIRMKPGEHSSGSPFEAFYDAFLLAFPALEPNPLEAPQLRSQRVEGLRQHPAQIAEFSRTALADRSAWAEILLVIDQFEETFTLVPEREQGTFTQLVIHAAQTQRMRVVVTLRADFYHRAIASKELTQLLEAGTFPLTAPSTAALYQMITRPADRAALSFEEGLAEQILSDTGDDPGALALMAYTLDELYRARGNSGQLTFEMYHELGGVQGAIGQRAETTFENLPKDVQAQFPHVFQMLVSVDESGTATRRRCLLQQVATSSASQDLVDALTTHRLLLQDAQQRERIVEVAHEALLKSWQRLANWIYEARDDLRLLRQVRLAAQEWNRTDRSDEDYLWSQHRLKQVYEMRDRLGVRFDRIETYFVRPETERLLNDFKRFVHKPYRQLTIVDRWRDIGEAALPTLIEALRYSGEEALDVIMDTIAQVSLRKQALAVLQTTLQEHQAADLRAHAALFLGTLKPTDAANESGRIVMALIAALDDPVFWVSAAAARSLGLLRAMDAVEAVIQHLDTDQPLLRSALMRTLSQIVTPQAKDTLLGYLRDPQPEFRALAAASLSSIQGSDVSTGLTQIVNDPEPEVRRVVAEVLGRRGEASALEAILRLIQDSDATVSEEAQIALTAIHHPDAVSPLCDVLLAGYPTAQNGAAYALGLIGEIAALPALEKTLESMDPQLRKSAAKALGKLKGEEVVLVLLQALTHMDGEVRAEAAAGIGLHERAEITPALIRALHDPVQEVQRQAVLALGQHGDPAALLPLLETLCQSNDDSQAATEGMETPFQLTAMDTGNHQNLLASSFNHLVIHALHQLEKTMDAQHELRLILTTPASIRQHTADLLHGMAQAPRLQLLLQLPESLHDLQSPPAVAWLQQRVADTQATFEQRVIAQGVLQAYGHPILTALEPYHILEALTDSNGLTAYKAVDQEGRLIILKDMLDTVRMEEVGQLLATLEHPGIPTFYGYSMLGEKRYLMYEFLEGKTLEQLVTEQKTLLPILTIMDWAFQICDILSYLHTQEPPLLFRDLKPAMIRVGASGRIQLIEFDILEVYEPGKQYPVLGTEGYSPPEQYRGQNEPRSDLYALGATLHHLLTGSDPRLEPPFSFEDRPIMEWNINSTPKLATAVMKALAFTAEDRYSSAQEMKKALQAALG